MVFLVEIQNAKAMYWNVSPMIGAGIAAAGDQIDTTVITTYAVDCYSNDAGHVRQADLGFHWSFLVSAKSFAERVNIANVMAGFLKGLPIVDWI